jgi:hypothetical protein
MSYDLFLEARSGKKIDKKAFSAYFKGRRHYEVTAQQAIYQNEDTGVYFIFDAPEAGVVAFNLNFFRPHVFGMEAALEVEAFAKAFDATAMDESGEEWPTFDRVKFIKAWNYGNRFAYRAMLRGEEAGAADGPVHTWPSKKIRDAWEWNYSRPANENRVDGNVFVPGIFAEEVRGELWSVAIWPPECPVLLPEVDGVRLPLAQQGKGSDDLTLVAWEEVLPVVKRYVEKGKGIARYRLDFEDWPAEVANFLGKKRRMVEGEGVGLDEVLDREMVEEARGG